MPSQSQSLTLNALFKLILILISLSDLCSATQPLQGFHSYQVIASQGGGSPMVDSGTGVLFAFALPVLMGNVTQYGHCISGMKFQQSTMLNFDTTLSYSSGSQIFTIGLFLSQANIYSITFYIIAFESNLSGDFGVASATYIASSLNISSRTSDIENFTQKYLPIQYTSAINIHSFIVGFNAQSINNSPIMVRVYCNSLFITDATTMQPIMAIQTLPDNTVVSVSYTVIAFESSRFSSKHIIFYHVNYGFSSGSIFSSFGIPASFGPNFNGNCTIGFAYLKVNSSVPMSAVNEFNFNATTTAGITNSVISGFGSAFYLQEGVGCFASCSPNEYVYSSSSCRFCNISIPFCYNCTTSANCLSCLSGYYIDTPTSCIPCALPSCVACSSASICTLCQANTSLLVNGACFSCSYSLPDCLYCVNSSACTECISSSYFLSNTSQCLSCQFFQAGCLSCNTTLNICLQCSNNFILSANGICIACGVYMAQCYSCSSINICLSCSATPEGAYYLSTFDNQCYPCSYTILNCLSCTTSSSCSECISGFYVSPDTSRCLPCSNLFVNCSKCLFSYVANEYVCSLCSPGSLLNIINCNNILIVDVECLPCDIPHCISCAPYELRCMACEAQFYYNPTTSFCQPCRFPCLTCISETLCLTCVSTYCFDAINSLCLASNSSMVGCSLCSSLTNCSQCTDTTYFLLNNAITSESQCFACSIPCLTCTSPTICLSCSDVTFFVDPVNNFCVHCNIIIPNCNVCSPDALCLSCITGYYSSFVGDQCIPCGVISNCSVCSTGPICLACISEFFIDPNYQHCLPCVSPCVRCSNEVSCLSCEAQYYLSGISCLACSSKFRDCLSCTALVCLSCTNNAIINNQTQSCLTCPSSSYSNITTQICSPCLLPCLECFNQSICLSCINASYSLNLATHSCDDTCGDSLVLQNDCDLPLGIQYDGCTDTCQIEDQFVCHTQANLTSTCTFTGNLTLNLNSIENSLFHNQITLKISISPYIHGFTSLTNIFTQDTIKSIIQLTQNHSQRPTPAGNQLRVLANFLDSSSISSYELTFADGYLNCMFLYTESIRWDDFSLHFNFSAFRMPIFLNLTDIQYAFNIASSDSSKFIGVFNSGVDTLLSQIIYYGCLGLGAAGLLIFLAGLFSKELAGLEYVMTCQFVYISLFWYENMLPLPVYGLSSLRITTGYLNLSSNFKSDKGIGLLAPQLGTLQINPSSLINNYSYTSLLLLLPFAIALIVLPFKLKVIRKNKFFEFGNKIIDCALGEYLLYFVCFNLQYFLVLVILYYRSNSAQILNYASQTIAIFTALIMIFSLVGLMVRPDFYGRFRCEFKQPNNDLNQSNLSPNSPNPPQSCFNSFKQSINRIYIRKQFPNLFRALSYNHYIIYLAYLALITLLLTCIQNMNASTTISLVLQILFLAYLIFLRPYGSLTSKIRSILFGFIMMMSSLVRVVCNFESNTSSIQTSVYSALVITVVIFLFVGLIISVIQIVQSIVSNIQSLRSKRKIVATKMFKDMNNLDLEKLQEQNSNYFKNLDNLFGKYHILKRVVNPNELEEIVPQKEVHCLNPIMPLELNYFQRLQKSREHPIQDEIRRNAEYISRNGWSENDNGQHQSIDANLHQKEAQEKDQSILNQLSKAKQIMKSKLQDKLIQQQELYEDEESSPQRLRLIEEKFSELEQEDLEINEEAEDEEGDASARKIKQLPERILYEENYHLRYQNALKFIHKYGKIDGQLVDNNYHHI